MTDEESGKEEPPQEEKPKEKEKVPLNSWAESRLALKAALRGPTPSAEYMRGLHKRHPWLFYFGLTTGFIFYAVLGYLAITHLLEPPLISIYAFTNKEAEQIGIILEADILSATFIGIIAYLLGKRSGRKEINYEKLRLLLKEDRKELVKALKAGKEEEKEEN